jgi:hypothetical protein
MPKAKITGQGLCTFACSVALLWSYLIGQRVAAHLHAQKPQRPAPAAAPEPGKTHRLLALDA